MHMQRADDSICKRWRRVDRPTQDRTPTKNIVGLEQRRIMEHPLGRRSPRWGDYLTGAIKDTASARCLPNQRSQTSTTRDRPWV